MSINRTPYETPAMTILELKYEGIICDSRDGVPEMGRGWELVIP